MAMLTRSLAQYASWARVLHPGNQAWWAKRDWVWDAKAEHQAEEFAAWLLLPKTEDYLLAYMSPAEAAKRYRVTEELVKGQAGWELAGVACEHQTCPRRPLSKED